MLLGEAFLLRLPAILSIKLPLPNGLFSKVFSRFPESSDKSAGLLSFSGVFLFRLTAEVATNFRL